MESEKLALNKQGIVELCDADASKVMGGFPIWRTIWYVLQPYEAGRGSTTKEYLNYPDLGSYSTPTIGDFTPGMYECVSDNA